MLSSCFLGSGASSVVENVEEDYTGLPSLTFQRHNPEDRSTTSVRFHSNTASVLGPGWMTPMMRQGSLSLLLCLQSLGAPIAGKVSVGQQKRGWMVFFTILRSISISKVLYKFLYKKHIATSSIVQARLPVLPKAISCSGQDRWAAPASRGASARSLLSQSIRFIFPHSCVN